ncbi:MAG: hypothetical protein J0H61_05370 [Alphaproteobacteria bacterium]|nr:hypothetical protein [Alphaproteobacteria bacterium]
MMNSCQRRTLANAGMYESGAFHRGLAMAEALVSLFAVANGFTFQAWSMGGGSVGGAMVPLGITSSPISFSLGRSKNWTGNVTSSAGGAAQVPQRQQPQPVPSQGICLLLVPFLAMPMQSFCICIFAMAAGALDGCMSAQLGPTVPMMIPRARITVPICRARQVNIAAR